MQNYFLNQTAKCVVSSAVDYIKSGRSIPGVTFEGRWGRHLVSQTAYNKAIAAIPGTVRLLNTLSLEDRTSILLNIFETDPQYVCARGFTQRTASHFPITLAIYVDKAWRDRITKNW